MAQYDIVFAVNSASSGVAFSEIVLPKSPGSNYALTQNPTNGALGWSAFEPAFTKLTAFNKNFGTTAGTVCQGNDIRLSDARPASDVYAWAKAATKPSYTYSEVGAAAASHTHAYVPTSRTISITGSEEGSQSLSANRTWIIDKIMRRRGVNSHSDFNTAIVDGAFTVWDGNWLSAKSNSPKNTAAGYGVFFSASTVDSATDAKMQMFADNVADSHLYIRTGWGSSWNSWKRLATIDEVGGGSSLWSETGSDIYRSSRVGIKNTSPSYDLDVSGTARVTTGIYTPKIYGSGDTNTYLDWVSSDQLRIVVGGLEMMRFVESTYDRIGVKLSSPSYDFDVNGDIHASGDILSNSDMRLKKNIHPLPVVANKIKQLRPVMFDWRETDKGDIGLIAQEVEQLFPCLVRTDEQGFKSVNYQKLTVLLLKALQEIL